MLQSDNTYLTSSCDPVIPPTKESTMKTIAKLPLYLALITLIFLSLISSAGAWELEKVGVEGKVEDVQQEETR